MRGAESQRTGVRATFIPRITRTDVRTGKMEVLVESYQGKPLVAPNDVTIDGKGRLYFTDPGGVAVYRIDGNGQVARILAAPDIQRPNGIQISPDDKQLYLIEANNTEGGARMIRAYGLGPDGAVANMRVHYNFYPGRSADGMSIDTQGNLYASAGMNQLRGTSETLDTKTVVQNPDRDYRTSALAWLVPPRSRLTPAVQQSGADTGSTPGASTSPKDQASSRATRPTTCGITQSCEGEYPLSGSERGGLDRHEDLGHHG
jgi:secreted PhoX family phosphatase